MGMRQPAFIVLLVIAGASAAAQQPVGPVNTDATRLALHGFDSVAYFTQNKAVKGSPNFQFEWNGAVWRFASAANRDAFATRPETYAPQFGGYCAWAVSRNYTADVDAEAFTIANGKLYLNYSKLVQLRWQLDRLGNIAKGEANWPKVIGQAAKGAR